MGLKRDIPRKTGTFVGSALLALCLPLSLSGFTAAQSAGTVCTTDPADRANCRNPSGTIDPDGGDLDGDGVFEDHEPVGPGYKDPRAYDGGKTSGETQCEWLRSQGIAC